jgi:thymidylate synthase (FAD)
MTADTAPTINGTHHPSDPAQAGTPLTRASVPALDAVLGQPFRVLDDGFVRVVDYMGSDEAIVQAARVSYGAGTRRLREDRGLIRYLMRHAHTTPFEMCEIKLHVRVPMDIWRQWIRHRTANVNEYSTRYSVAIDAAQRTSPDAWRRQSTTNRQGSAGHLDTGTGAHLTAREAALQAQARAVYEERLAAGVAREQARKDLPLATYTEAYWKIDLHNLLHFLRLRMDSHAQQEIRDYARTIGDEIVARWCPLAWEAFLEYAVHGLSLTEADVAIISHLTAGQPAAAIGEAERRGLLPRVDGQLRPSRERAELETKLARLGLTPPW